MNHSAPIHSPVTSEVLPEYPLPLSHEDRLEFEDEQRALPDGWIRQFDRNTTKHFYVNVSADPPRACWSHPLDEPAELLDDARLGEQTSDWSSKVDSFG